MAKYSADIQIAVRGGQQLNNTIKQLNKLNNSINVINRNAKLLEGKGFNVASVENYSRAVSKAERAVRRAAEGTNQERQAITALVSAMELENKARERKNILIAREIANRRRVIATADAGVGIQGPALPSYMLSGPRSPIGGLRSRDGGGGRSNAGSAISSALIGGGFPLLFGQGPAAAAGGALGGLAGGILGGGFGFALSIVGTAIGDAITESEKFDKALATLNGTLNSMGSESLTTAADVNKLAKSLNVTKEEALELLGAFKQFSSGSTRQALAGVFAPVGGAATFEAIARAGIDEKNAVSSIFALRQQIGNEAALQLALQLQSVGASKTQAKLLELIAARSIEISVAQASQVTFADRLLSIWENIVSGVATALNYAIKFIAKMQEGSLIKLPFLDRIARVLGAVTGRTPQEIAGERGSTLRAELQNNLSAVRAALRQETGVLGAEQNLQEQFRTGPKPPEDRTAQLREEFAAIVAIGQAENTVRDLLFDGRDVLAAEVELNKELTDITRDRNKALIGANYESEKAVINKIAEARALSAQLKTEDKIRDINQKRFEQELQTQEAVRNSVQSFIDVRQQQDLQLQYSKTYARLVTEGMLPAEAERVANYEKLVAEQTKGVELQIQTTQAAILEAQARGLSATKLQEQLDVLIKQRDAIASQAGIGPGAARTERERMIDAISTIQGEFNLLISSTNQLTAAATSVGDAFATSFKGIISGSMTAKESLAGFFQSVADYFLDMASQIIQKWIQMTILNSIVNLFPVSGGGGGGGLLGFGGSFDAGVSPLSGVGNFSNIFRAKGGPVMSGSPYIVGERGPELFVPGRSGTIVPNERMGGVGGTTNVVVNVDAKGSSVQGDDGRANELGRVVSAAVQSEIIKQQRPGGLLAGTR